MHNPPDFSLIFHQLFEYSHISYSYNSLITRRHGQL
jgi:hypothetical protein